MSEILNSYVAGRWIAGGGDGTPLHNPTTEEVVARSSTRGIDFEAALDYARTRGGAALREMTFAQRGELLGAMSKAIHGRRDELIDLAIRNGGNTRSDAKFDIDGATYTLSYYGKLGGQLGDERLLSDGQLEQLGRSPRFVGTHVLAPLTGAAVHINAFNFPAWGLAEKAAAALLAGMPVVTKPATSTAVLAVRIVEILIEDQVLPQGALSLISGSPGDLLSHLTPRDVLAFTGSAGTGNALRGLKHIVDGSIRVNVEADSLNAAVLGADVEVGSDTWELFLRDVVRDVTQKAGQKCTAIRRVFAPARTVEDVAGAFAERLGEVIVGDPALREVRMGPLATRDQLEDVRAGIDLLAGCADLVFGDGSRGGLVGVDGERGFFCSPVLLRSDDPAAAEAVHRHEVFGPAATLMSYSGASAHASELVQLGGGGLVASIYTDDRQIASDMLFGIAPFHGRLNIGSAKVAEHSPGPGTVLPALVHGGPGRAGGGEELGGTRGMAFYMQRTAVQGDRPLLEKILPAVG